MIKETYGRPFLAQTQVIFRQGFIQALTDLCLPEGKTQS